MLVEELSLALHARKGYARPRTISTLEIALAGRRTGGIYQRRIGGVPRAGVSMAVNFRASTGGHKLHPDPTGGWLLDPFY